MNPYIGIHLMYAYLSEMLSTLFLSKINVARYRLGLISEKRCAITDYLLTKRVCSATRAKLRFVATPEQHFKLQLLHDFQKRKRTIVLSRLRYLRSQTPRE